MPLENAVARNGMHVCDVCKHTWVNPNVCANPLAGLQPFLTEQGAVALESQRTWELTSAAKFARFARTETVHLVFVE